jgi:hypothetical protein
VAPKTCRQSSITHACSPASEGDQASSSAKPSRRAGRVKVANWTPSSSTATAECVCLCGSTPIVTIALSLQLGGEADPWRTIFSWGDATLLLGHARASLAATGDNFHAGQNHPTKGARVSPKPSGTIHHAPHQRNTHRLASH